MEKGKPLSKEDLDAVSRYNENRGKKHEVVFVSDSESEDSFLHNNFNLDTSGSQWIPDRVSIVAFELQPS